jgi:hypothetical protein
MKRYSIMARGRHSDHEVEVCQVDSHPEEVVNAARQKSLMVRLRPGGRRVKVAMYEHLYVIDLEGRSPRIKTIED